jgi:hypothetical protein
MFPAAKGRSAFVFSAPSGTVPTRRSPLTPLSHPADTNTKRETGRTAQLNNIAAAKVRFSRRHRANATAGHAQIWRSVAVADGREIALGTAPKKRPSLTSRASPFRNPGCLRHHPHHPRSALDAEDDPGRLRRYVSSRARDRAAPEGDRGHSRFKPNGAEKSKRSFRFDFSFLDAMLTFSLFRSTDLFAFD